MLVCVSVFIKTNYIHIYLLPFCPQYPNGEQIYSIIRKHHTLLSQVSLSFLYIYNVVVGHRATEPRGRGRIPYCLHQKMGSAF